MKISLVLCTTGVVPVGVEVSVINNPNMLGANQDSWGIEKSSKEKAIFSGKRANAGTKFVANACQGEAKAENSVKTEICRFDHV